MSAVFFLLPTSYCLLSTAYCPLSTAYCQLCKANFGHFLTRKLAMQHYYAAHLQLHAHRLLLLLLPQRIPQRNPGR